MESAINIMYICKHINDNMIYKETFINKDDVNEFLILNEDIIKIVDII